MVVKTTSDYQKTTKKTSLFLGFFSFKALKLKRKVISDFRFQVSIKKKGSILYYTTFFIIYYIYIIYYFIIILTRKS